MLLFESSIPVQRFDHRELIAFNRFRQRHGFSKKFVGSIVLPLDACGLRVTHYLLDGICTSSYLEPASDKKTTKNQGGANGKLSLVLSMIGKSQYHNETPAS